MIYGTLIVVAVYYLIPLYVNGGHVAEGPAGNPARQHLRPADGDHLFEPWARPGPPPAPASIATASRAASGTRCASPCRRCWSRSSSRRSTAMRWPTGASRARTSSSRSSWSALHSLTGDDLSDRDHPAGDRPIRQPLGLVIVHSIFGMPILTLLFRNYFASVPEELLKAARVDGAGFWLIYFRIMLPMRCRSSSSPSSCRSPASGTTSCSASSTRAPTPIR